MKLAVYAICKDEIKFVDRFIDSMQEVGLQNVYVLDTGSTDGTLEALRDHGANVDFQIISPWRFDVARNHALACVPEYYDVCFSFDLDEVPTGGWSAAVQRAFGNREQRRAGTGPDRIRYPYVWNHTPNGGAGTGPDRIRYPYVWNHTPNGGDGISFLSEKCHTRRNWIWRKPVHEILKFHSPNEMQATTYEFAVHHWADDSKARTSYLPLLELSVQEEPDDDRNAHYLGREYHLYGRHSEAIAELKRHLALPKALWMPERAASMKLLSRSYDALGDREQALAWAMRACAEAPGEREPWVHLASLSLTFSDYLTCSYAAHKALAITERPMTYICEPEAWGARPYDLAGVAEFYLGRTDAARALLRKAYDLEPTDPRLLKNLEFVL